MKAEHALIGAFLTHVELRSKIIDEVRPYHFTDSRVDIFTEMIAGYADGQAVDWAWIESRFVGREIQGAVERDITNALRVVNVSNLDQHIDLVKGAWVRRMAINTLSDGIGKLGSSTDPGGLISTIIGKLEGIEDHKEVGALNYQEIFEEYVRTIDRGELPKSVKFPYEDWNDVTGGIYDGDLIVMAARPGVGKTTVAMDIARQLVKSGMKVAYFLLEMKKEQGAVILMSQETDIGTVALRSMRLTDEQRAKLDQVQPYKGSMFLVDDCNTIDDIKIRARKLANEHKGLDLIIVDYLQLVQHNDITDRYGLVTHTSLNMKKMAMDSTIGAPVIALSQLSRVKGNLKPTLTDLRESGSIEQDADSVIFIHAPDGVEVSTRDILFRKNRWGRLNDFDYIIQNRKLKRVGMGDYGPVSDAELMTEARRRYNEDDDLPPF